MVAPQRYSLQCILMHRVCLDVRVDYYTGMYLIVCYLLRGTHHHTGLDDEVELESVGIVVIGVRKNCDM